MQAWRGAASGVAPPRLDAGESRYWIWASTPLWTSASTQDSLWEVLRSAVSASTHPVGRQDSLQVGASTRQACYARLRAR